MVNFMREKLLNIGMTNHPELGCARFNGKFDASCRFEKYVGNTTFLGVKIINNWRSTCDGRVLCLLTYLKELDNDALNHVQCVSWHGGQLFITLRPLKLKKKCPFESPEPFSYGNEEWYINWWYSLFFSSALNLPNKNYISGSSDLSICGDVWVYFIDVAPNLYAEYITSDLWKERSKAYRQKRRRCELCGSKHKLATHHRVYPKDFNDDCEANWICVCEICHEKLHGLNKKNHYD